MVTFGGAKLSAKQQADFEKALLALPSCNRAFFYEEGGRVMIDPLPFGRREEKKFGAEVRSCIEANFTIRRVTGTPAS